MTTSSLHIFLCLFLKRVRNIKTRKIWGLIIILGHERFETILSETMFKVLRSIASKPLLLDCMGQYLQVPNKKYFEHTMPLSCFSSSHSNRSLIENVLLLVT